MPRFTFQYRGGEIIAFVEAANQGEALQLIVQGDKRATFIAQPEFTHGDMWETCEDDGPMSDLEKAETERTLEIEVTQFLRPNGQKRTQYTMVNPQYRDAYKRMQAAGWYLTAEMLDSQNVHLCLANPHLEEDVLQAIVPNGPAIHEALESFLAACTDRFIASNGRVKES